MGDIRMTGEIRTDYDCEVAGLPAERWGEAVFKVNDEEIVLEIVTVALEDKLKREIMIPFLKNYMAPFYDKYRVLLT